MADEERLTASLQESLLCLLAFNDKEGAEVSTFIRGTLFDEPYRGIAQRVLDYRDRFGKAPGAHIDDLFDHVLGDKENPQSKTYSRLLSDLYSQSKTLNAKYVSSRVSEFVKHQSLKQVIFRAAERYQQGGDAVDTDVERILSDATRINSEIFNSGVFLNDKAKALSFLDRQDDENRLKLGIEEFDRRGLCPTRGEMFLFVAPRKRGKSWFVNMVGRQALLQSWNVCHISLEMGEEVVLQRYFQSLFGIAKRREEYLRAEFDRDKNGRVILDDRGRVDRIIYRKAMPELTFEDRNIRKKLGRKVDEWESKFAHVVVKQFPSGQLRIDQLRTYLDYLERARHFVPDLLVVDYPDLMWYDNRNPRMSIGRNFVDLRGLGVERNFAVLAPTQGTRGSGKAQLIDEQDIAEDISKANTADIVLTYNQTKFEHRRNLARLYVSNARNDADRFAVHITQSYAVGQFVIDSGLMDEQRYFKELKEELGEEDGGDEAREYEDAEE